MTLLYFLSIAIFDTAAVPHFRCVYPRKDTIYVIKLNIIGDNVPMRAEE